MLVFIELAADFSRGCAGMRLGYILLATHPHPGIRESRHWRHVLAAHRSGFMQNRGYGLSRMHLPRRLVNKAALNATDSLGWHHAHGVSPKEEGE
jgi:hypothetical protein